MKRILVALALALSVVACSDSNPAPAPSPAPAPTPGPPPLPTTFSLSGRITAAGGNSGIPGALITVLDGPNAGKVAGTDGNGNYNLIGLTMSGFTVSIVGNGFAPVTRPVSLSGNITLNATLLPSALFFKEGFGNTVFDMPTYITRVRIQGVWNRTSTSNFIVSIGGRLVLNEILRTSFTYDGIHLTNGGIVQIESSGQISWSFTEVR